MQVRTCILSKGVSYVPGELGTLYIRTTEAHGT